VSEWREGEGRGGTCSQNVEGGDQLTASVSHAGIILAGLDTRGRYGA
jgi:hypothetical protein